MRMCIHGINMILKKRKTSKCDNTLGSLSFLNFKIDNWIIY